MDTALGHRLIERILGCDWFSILLIELAARPVNMDKPSRLDMLLGLKRSDLKLPRKPLAFFALRSTTASHFRADSCSELWRNAPLSAPAYGGSGGRHPGITPAATSPDCR
jgi:hypothetical protein